MPTLPVGTDSVPVDESAWSEFRESVHSALVRLFDPPALETHPLAALAHAAPGSRERTPGRALHASLLAAIDAISADVRSRGAQSRAARLARLRYVEGDSIERVREELAIGRSEYFREHGRALDAIAAVLRARWGTGAALPSITPDGGTLPRETTSFVGRQSLLTEIVDLLLTSPLVTLIGAGGGGKTRLALAAGRAIKQANHGAGRGSVWFVDLTGLLADSRVDQVVAATLRLRRDCRPIPYRRPARLPLLRGQLAGPR